MKFHINNNMEVKPCLAQDGRCPFADNLHFDNEEEAKQKAQQLMERQFFLRSHVNPENLEKIYQQLNHVQKEKEVKILFAVEGGSRAYGLNSPNSDHDVYFVYAHPLDWYLSISEERDVIEAFRNSEIEMSGWDIRKALHLFKKSNPSLLEWISSPLIYIDEMGIRDRFQDLQKNYYGPRANIFHYNAMATGNNNRYLQGETVKVKKYLNVLRPIFACEWIEKHGTVPPVEFDKLKETIQDNHEVYGEVLRLQDLKMTGDTAREIPPVPLINQYINERLKHFDEYAKTVKDSTQLNNDYLSDWFREIVKST